MSSRATEGQLELPDVNVLVALLQSKHVHHEAASDWFASVRRLATTPTTEAGFLRISLNPLTGSNTTSVAALASLESLRADERTEFLPDDSSLCEPIIDLSVFVGHRQVTDLHLVNLAAKHNATLVTFDGKIARALTAADQRLVRTLH